MPDHESTLKGLSEVSEYLLAKTDIAGAGKGKEVFGFWYRSVEDALAMLKEQDKQIDDLKAELAKTEDNFSEYAEMMQEKQEPVKPIEEPYKIVCGSCGEKLAEICGDVDVVWNDDGKYPRYCPGCGRKVKWDE